MRAASSATLKGFVSIVVCPHFQAKHPIQLRTFGGQHQYRNVTGYSTDFPTHRKAIKPGQHQVENNQINAAFFKALKAIIPAINKNRLHIQAL